MGRYVYNKTGEPLTERIGTVVGGTVRRLLDETAQEYGLGLNEVIRESIIEGLPRYRAVKAREAARLERARERELDE